MNKIPTPPGYLIKECLDKTDISMELFAKIMHMEIGEVYKLLYGTKKLTYKTARILESLFGIGANTWMNIEYSYRDNLRQMQDTIKQKCSKFYGMDCEWCPEVYSESPYECKSCNANTGCKECYLYNTCDTVKYFE